MHRDGAIAADSKLAAVTVKMFSSWAPFSTKPAIYHGDKKTG